jgi:hypothetical protein
LHDIEIHCDNQACVDILNKGPNEGSLTALEKAESDIIKSIFANLKDFKSVIFLWVKGHQDEDDDTPIEKRPLPVRLNIACDTAAKKCMRESAHPTTRPKPLEGAQATLYFGNTMVTTDMKAQIQFASQAPKMRAYICERLEWTDSQYSTVNWSTLGRAKKRLKLHESIRITKMLYENLNVGKQKQMKGQDGTCPCCGLEMEDQMHLYQCSNEEMTDAFNDAIITIKSMLVKDGIPSDVYNAYIHALCSAARRDHPDITYTGPKSNEIFEILEQQSTLGLISVLSGFLHKEWTYLLQRKKMQQVKKPAKEGTREKDAVEQTVSLIRGSWNLFEAVWKTRNNILHGGDNEIDERAQSQMFGAFIGISQGEILTPATLRPFHHCSPSE